MVNMIRSDLDFILAQIKIAEADARHDADPVNNPAILGTVVPNAELPWGLRRVDGSNNNLYEGLGDFGAADQPFPRGTDPSYTTGTGSLAFGPPILDGSGQPISIPGVNGGTTGVPLGYIPGPGGNWLNENDYGVPTPNTDPNPRAIQPGDVVDADPRIISNLIVDQTLNNPAAVYKALLVAEAADPFAAMQTIMTAVGVLKDAKADLAAAQAASSSGAVAAYTTVVTESGDLGVLAVAVDTETSDLVAAINSGNVADAQAALADAIAAVSALSTAAGEVSTALTAAGASAVPADVAAVATFIQVVGQISSQLASIDLSDGQINFPVDTFGALFAELAGNDVDTLAGSLHSQLTNTLNGIDPDVAAAEAAVSAAEEVLSDLITPFDVTTNPTGLTAGGLTVEADADGNILKDTLVIENTAPDEGLSAPFNGWMTLFGQFFDHGLDLVAKGGFGTVYIPLQPDDPLYVPGGNSNFMPVTRATLGPDGQPVNKVTPFVDQNQTYTSNASHQFFLREYELRDDGAGNLRPVATGRLLDGDAASGGGIPTWADVKAQALNVLGIELNDFNIHSVPEIVIDAYGNFIPGTNGFPQLVRSIDVNGVVTAEEASLATPLRTIDGQVSTGHAFLDDIAHTANPGTGEAADGDAAIGLANAAGAPVSNTGNYDNELLDRHYITGDGRGNENIGLTAVHHVFHSEHNRQIDLIKDLVLNEAKAAAAALALDPLNVSLQAEAADKLAFLNEWTDVDLTAANIGTATTGTVVWDGDRMFQAAKFPTEMQYQHLVFEEFARKVQPAVNVFNDYDATLDPAILAEFAHTVYRFGHSMLTETVDRYNADWTVTNGGATQEQIGLIDAFLNPLEFAASGVDAEAAAGAIARGMTRQTGNEIDEFVTEALRNNLVGLPLDLAAINIARGRETGVPTLNEARAQFYLGSGDAQVKPYESWAEFALNIKNPASVVNFIAAYGTHSTITSVTTVEDKRDAAMALVLGGPGAPADRVDFLNATGGWTRDNDATLGGLNNVDFWIGGLAEKKLIFGGFLGSTFNFVFETQLEALQNGDRFYYLSRLANLNLTAQLENNKFSEMIHRNTDATHLPGDAFARPDFFLEVDQTKQFNGDLGAVDPTFADIGGGDPFLGALNPLVIRDTATNKLQYNGAEHVVLGGTDGNDILVGGLGDDTLWGDAGNDRLEGGDGNDFHFGGDGNDIITDLFGVNEIRANAGNDVVSVGPGINLIITDTGNDIVFGGRDDDESLLGQGNDFAFGGDGVDFTIGGEGSDWLESGNENGLILGDNGDLIQGLPIKIGVANAVGGDDIIIAGSGGNADMDAEAGDDIMVAGAGTDRFFGAQGFDWVTHKNATSGVEADMNVLLFQPPVGPASPSTILDRYATVEGLTGSQYGDILRGDSRTLNGELIDIVNPEADVGNPESHVLRNIDLIDGLREFLPIAIGGNPPTEIFDGGNIIMGGGGSDIIEGRGGDDLIDGDHALNVRIEVTADVTRGQTFENFSVNSIAEIRDRILTGEITADQLRVVREIINANTAGDVDAAEFSGFRAQYLIEGIDPVGATVGSGTGIAADVDGDGFISVLQLPTNRGDLVNGLGLDGHDRLKNIERLHFADQSFNIQQTNNSVAQGSVGITGNVWVGQTIEVDLSGVTDADNIAPGNLTGAITGPFTVYWQGEVGVDTGIFQTLTTFQVDTPVPITGPTLTLTPAMQGVNLRAVVQFVDGDNVIERVVSIPQVVRAPDGTGGVLIVPDPAVAIGPDLAGTVVDGVALVAGDVGILEDLGAFGTTPAGTPLTFTVDSLLVNIRAANPGATIDMVRGPSGTPTLTPRVAEGDPAPGTLSFDNGTQTFTFTPAANFNGGITFEFEVTTPAGVPAGAEATLEVFAVNDAPVAGTNTANIGAAVGAAGSTITFTEAQLIGNASDIDGDGIELFRDPNPLLTGADQWVTLADPGQGTLVRNADGSFTFTAAGGFTGDVELNYAITDRIAIVPTIATLNLTNAAATNPTLTTNATVINQGPGPVITANVGPTVGQAVTVNTATIVDANGVTGPFTIQWQAAPDVSGVPGAFANIGGANGTSFTPAAAQSGQFLRAQVTFTDAAGNVETVYGLAARVTGNTITGAAGTQTLGGTVGDDVISGLGGADILNGGNGNDLLIGGAGGVDRVNGEAGNDTAMWTVGEGNGANRDIVDGGLGGTDTFVINGNAANETYTVYAAADWLALAGGRTLLSGASDIVITRNGTGNGDVVAELDEIEEIIINTGAGTDTVNIVGDFNPTNLAFNTIHVNNEQGEDTVDVTEIDSEHRTVLAGEGSIAGKRDQDEQVAFEGTEISGNEVVIDDDADDATGDDDDENFVGNSGSNVIQGGGGRDRVDGGDGDDKIYGDDGDDSLHGGSGRDFLRDGAGNDTSWGDVGNDWFGACAGNDIYHGGDGNDTYYAGNIATRVAVNLATGRTNGVDTGKDTLTGIENAITGSGDDVIVGDGGSNFISGGAGSDKLLGGGGNDILKGGAGNDDMLGGAGSDRFCFEQGFGNDVIRDFDPDAGGGGQDKLDLTALKIAAADFNGRVDILDAGSDVLVKIDGGGTIRLKDVANANDVTISDFVLFS